jgi:hypothetical protein
LPAAGRFLPVADPMGDNAQQQESLW